MPRSPAKVERLMPKRIRSATPLIAADTSLSSAERCFGVGGGVGGRDCSAQRRRRMSVQQTLG